jgi:hypothetical protein
MVQESLWSVPTEKICVWVDGQCFFPPLFPKLQMLAFSCCCCYWVVLLLLILLFYFRPVGFLAV